MWLKLLIVFLLAFIFNYEKYQKFQTNAKAYAKRQFNIIRYGEKRYVEKIISNQYDQNIEENNSEGNKVIETAILSII